MGRRGPIVVAGLLAVALVAGACSSGSDDSSGSDGDGAGPTYGGKAVYALEAESSGGWCIPEAQLAISGMLVARSIYDFLTVPNDEGGFSPYLAESVEPNADATQFTIKLRPDIKFHDGTALDSTVLKNNIDAWLGRYPGRTSLILVIVLQQVDTVEIVDDLTVSITTKIPWPALPAYLYGGGRLGIMAQAQLDDPDDCDKNLIGTGPYMLDEWKINDHLTLNRNPDYWATDAEGNQLPYLDSLEFKPVVDAQARVNGLLSGEFDLMMTSSAQATDILDDEADSGSVDLVQTTVNAEVGNIMFNESKPPFDDQGAREAVATALDRQTYTQVINLGLFEMASGPFPPGAPAYLEDAGFPEFDLQRAKDLVADYERRTGNPLEFSYSTANDEENVRTAQFVQQQLEAAGMTVNLQTFEQAVLIDTALGDNWNAMTYRNFPGGVPDGNYVWWHTGSPANFGKVSDAELDSLMDAGRSELDADKAELIYQDANRRLAEQVHFSWLNWTEWTIGTRTDIAGVMGPTLPDGQEPGLGLSTGHATDGIYFEG